MTQSFTLSATQSFTLTHARHMAAKVATDLKRMQRMYGKPSDTEIAEYESEAIEFLKAGYLNTVSYGFQRDNQWIEPTLQYTARDLAGGSANDDDPGRVRPGANIVGASFYSYMTYSAPWNALPESARQEFRKGLPFTRAGAPQPGINGYVQNDRTYSAGGRALDRGSVRSY